MCVLSLERAIARASFQVKLMYNVFLSLFLENEDLCGVMSYSSLALSSLLSLYPIINNNYTAFILASTTQTVWCRGAYVEQTNHLTELIGIK